MIDLIIQYKELIKIFYALIIVLTCMFIVFRTDKFFKISAYQGIRYFRNAFFFYGIAFAIRYFLVPLAFYEGTMVNFAVVKFLFEYFIIIAGFSLFYSLIWKKIELSDKGYNSSLFNKSLALFYFMAFVIVFIDGIWKVYYAMFISQILLFSSALIVSYSNYRRKGGKHKFLKFYFIAMLLSLIVWIFNAFIALYFEWDINFLISIYILNMIIFMLFLYGIIKVTNIRKV